MIKRAQLFASALLACMLCAAALAGCSSSASSSAASGSASSATSSESSASASSFIEVPEFHNSDLGNGWKAVDTLKLDYATCFAVDYYEGGYKLACLSDGGRYLIVPEGAEVPAGIDEDIVVLQQPLTDVYMVASDTMCLFDALGTMDSITVSGIKRDDWYIPAAVEAMDNGSIVYGGKYNAPDYDLLLSKQCKLSIQSTMINHTPAVREKLIELGIPVLIEQSSTETEPLGRTEWLKLYGAMFNKEDLANELFDKQKEQAEAVKGAETGKTVAFFYINSNGAAVVRKPGDYVTKMIDIAGGDYIFSTLDSEGSGMSTVTLEMERFYAQAKDADIIVYNATIDSGVKTLSDLMGKNELLGNFKAVKNGEVYVTEQNMYQQMTNTGDIIVDFNKVLSGDAEGLTYLHKMQ